jgi:AraC-like DNA-binding protein
MPLMLVPRHRALPAKDVVLRLRALLRASLGELLITADERPWPKLGDRWTRVPFLKIVSAGSLTVMCDQQRYRIGPGDAVLCRAQSYANLILEAECDFLRCTFDRDATLIGFGRWRGPRSAPAADEPLEDLDALLLDGTRSRLADELLAALPMAEAPSAALLRSLLWSLMQMLRTQEHTTAAEDGRHRAIVRLMEEHCAQELTRDAVAHQFGLSGAHLSRVLKNSTGLGFQALLMRLRLQRACDLLRYGNDAIAQIASQCGFSSSNYFCQAFRRAEGLAPGIWRRQVRSS